MTEFDPNSIEWLEPPARHTAVNSSPFIDALKANPGTWAVLRRDAETGKVYDLKNIPGIKTRSHPNGDGTSTVFAKWVGIDEFGNTILTPEEQERREARAKARAAKRAEREAAKEQESAPF